MKKILAIICAMFLMSCAATPLVRQETEDNSMCGKAGKHTKAMRGIFENEAPPPDGTMISTKLLQCVETEFKKAYFIYSVDLVDKKTNKTLRTMHVLNLLVVEDGE